MTDLLDRIVELANELDEPLLCKTPAYGVPGRDHCAACCYGTGIIITCQEDQDMADTALALREAVRAIRKGQMTIPIAFNMDLANGPTSARFCLAASELLGESIKDVVDELDDPELLNEEVDYWDARLNTFGYYVRWDAGDVVVYDLRGLSEDEKEAFYSEME